MAQIDYQAHNFTCYTVPECSSNDELELRPGDDGTAIYGSQESLNSTESTTSSIDNNILRKHHQQIKYYKKFFNPYVTSMQQQRISMPLMMNSMNSSQQLTPYQHYVNLPYQRQQLPPQFSDQQHMQQRSSVQSPQLGYFVPFAPNCYFSPPVQRKRYR